MAISTYAELRAAIINWSNRGDSKFANAVPDFVRLGETRLFRMLRLSTMIKSDTLTTTPAVRTISLPADWLQFKALRTDRGPLEYRPVDEIYAARDPWQGVYGIEGAQLVLGATPDAVEPIEVRYYARPVALQGDGDTNQLLVASPDLYLFAALIEGAVWQKNPDEAGRFGALLDKAIDAAKSADGAAMISGSPLRMRRR